MVGTGRCSVYTGKERYREVVGAGAGRCPRCREMPQVRTARGATERRITRGEEAQEAALEKVRVPV